MTPKKTLLLTGFGPFAEHKDNPTQILVNSFKDKTINNYQITSSVLDVSYDQSQIQIDSLIDKFNPDIILSLGLAADRDIITPELIAINYQHSKTADNDQKVRLFSKIKAKSKESFITTLPIKKIIYQFEQDNIPCQLSSSAGTYVCNTVMYSALRKIALDKRNCQSGFIHIPPHLGQDELTKAITSCINAL